MATLTGTPGNNVIHGTNTADTISGLAGNDRLYGASGDDSLGGDDGNDTLYGGSGNDYLLSPSYDGYPPFFDEGHDVAYGGAGNDFFYGVERNAGNDRMFGGPGNDVFDYTAGSTSFDNWFWDEHGFVPVGDDYIYGGAGIDRIQFSDPTPYPIGAGGSWGLSVPVGTDAVVVDLRAGTFSSGEASGNIYSVEEVMGSTGNDVILGKWTSEFLAGSHGDDYIAGRCGNDRIDGGWGADTLNGGAGRDAFVFNAIQLADYGDFTVLSIGQADVIEDFTRGRDKLVFENGPFGEWGAAQWGAAEDWFYAAAGATSGHDASDRLVYDTASGSLYYDIDGDGATEAFMVAHLQSAPALGADDITVI
jgi:Ca2+-binding RTX toxin-like protein